MATWVYKNGEGVLVDAHDVANHLKSGYTLDKNHKPAKKAKPKKAKADDEQKYI